MCSLTCQMPTTAMLGLIKIRNKEVYLGLLCAWQDPDSYAIIYCLPQCISRKMDQKWSWQDLDPSLQYGMQVSHMTTQLLYYNMPHSTLFQESHRQRSHRLFCKLTVFRATNLQASRSIELSPSCGGFVVNKEARPFLSPALSSKGIRKCLACCRILCFFSFFPLVW